LLALGGCGRKGALDLPPTGAAPTATSDTAVAPAGNSPFGVFSPPPEAKPSAAPGQKKRIILDPILD
jgi:predicted small lipoprotein YifL